MTPNSVPSFSKKYYFALVGAGFLLVFLSAYFARTWHYRHEAGRIKAAIGADFVPFTIESAIMYHYSREVAVGRGIPKYDPGLVDMDRIPVAAQMSVGLEYFLGYGYRLKNFLLGAGPRDEATTYEDDPDFSRWLRFQIRLWISLSSGLIFLWLITMRCPWFLALAGGLLHAVAPSAIARHTGQDLIRGNFALPLIAATFLLFYGAITRPARYKQLLLAGLAFLSVSVWDMTQICFGLWGGSEIIRLLAGGGAGVRRRNAWLFVYLALVAAGLLVPYHRAHQLLFSPTIFVIFPVIIGYYCLAPDGKNFARRLLWLGGGLAVLMLVWKTAATFSAYPENYLHFAELLKAKIRFMNVKPADPTLLGFDARVLWTPGMHSATWAMTRDFYFPFALYGLPALLLTTILARKARRAVGRGLGRSFFPLVMTVLYFIGYLFIVRYHEFCILFLCVALPLIAADLVRAWPSPVGKGLITAVLALLLFGEGKTAFSLERDYTGEYYRETAGLLQWLRAEGLRDQVFLADFTLSPMLKAYGRARILLQPQYELKKNRDNYEQFIMRLYHGAEPDFNAFCLKKGARFFVYDRGFGSPAPMHIYSPRYFAAAPRLEPSSPAWKMFYTPDQCRWFYRVEPPPALSYVSNKYFLYRVLAPDDFRQAMKLVIAGEAALSEGRPAAAAELARQAFRLDPNSESAHRLYFQTHNRLPRIRLGDYARPSGPES